MAKMRTHSGSKKRFRLTAGGLVKRAKQGKNHILNKKSRKRKRNLRQGGYVHSTQEVMVKSMLQGN